MKINFNPLSPCGERRLGRRKGRIIMAISIHSPHAGRDKPVLKISSYAKADFNPLSPCGERPKVAYLYLTA